jgi:hypothetical protein
MYETIARRDEHVPLWLRVFNGDVGVANEIFDGFAAAVDWPTSTVWREMADLYPDVPVVLTRRSSADAWWQSASKTVFPLIKTLNEDEPVDIEFGINMMSRLRTDVELADAAALKAIVDDEAGMKAAYERHLAEVELAIDPLDSSTTRTAPSFTRPSSPLSQISSTRSRPPARALAQPT